MWGDIYASEKLRELEAERTRHIPERPPCNRKPVLGSAARRAGRALQRLGERLESWGSSPPARETDAAC
jgi:hypothetical protein